LLVSDIDSSSEECFVIQESCNGEQANIVIVLEPLPQVVVAQLRVLEQTELLFETTGQEFWESLASWCELPRFWAGLYVVEHHHALHGGCL
jgi:hypothetical protein